MQIRPTLARDTRREAAELAFLRFHPIQASNSEEATYTNPPPGGLNYIVNYSKGLPHINAGATIGQVQPAAYRLPTGRCSGPWPAATRPTSSRSRWARPWRLAAS